MGRPSSAKGGAPTPTTEGTPGETATTGETGTPAETPTGEFRALDRRLTKQQIVAALKAPGGLEDSAA